MHKGILANASRAISSCALAKGISLPVLLGLHGFFLTVTADHVNEPLECYASILQLFLYIFLYNFLPIFLYAFIGISLEIVGGQMHSTRYGVLGCFFIGGMG
jgi:hypothetical protein